MCVFLRRNLEELLDLVHCKILSHCCSESMDAYLLRSALNTSQKKSISDKFFFNVPVSSESSLYVSENRFLLKTCGTTALFRAIEPLMSLVQSYFPSSTVVVRLSLSFSLSL